MENAHLNEKVNLRSSTVFKEIEEKLVANCLGIEICKLLANPDHYQSYIVCFKHSFEEDESIVQFIKF